MQELRHAQVPRAAYHPMRAACYIVGSTACKARYMLMLAKLFDCQKDAVARTMLSLEV